jgi:hypothetical protein
MLGKIHGTNFFHIKFLGRTNIGRQNGPGLPPAKVLCFNSLALDTTLPFESLYLLKRPHHNPLGSLKDLSIHRDRQREATLLY